MRILSIRFTHGGKGLMPGGVILRAKPNGEEVCHMFIRKPGSSQPTGYVWGAYGKDAGPAFKERVAREDRAGHLISNFPGDERKALNREEWLVVLPALAAIGAGLPIPASNY